MQLGNGVELIPKRDKVTYATNILGKWEDFSIETYQGKVLKEAAERYKLLLKAGKQAEVEADVPSLKALLLSGEVAVEEPVVEDDFWSVPAQPEVTQEAPEPFVPIVLTEANPTKFVQPDGDDGRRYVIKAKINKATGRQMYLSGWDDSDDWNISVVPYVASKAKCEYLIALAKEKIEVAASEKKQFLRKFPEEINFEIVEWIDNHRQLTYEEIVEAANKIKAQNAEKRGSKS